VPSRSASTVSSMVGL